MRPTKLQLASCLCLVSVVMLCAAQSVKKPGLWEITSTTTWQKSPLPEGTEPPAGSKAAFGGGPHTSKVCITQEMIDTYGAPMPQSRDCRVENLVKTPKSMKADWVCSGRMNGKGTLESNETEEGHAEGTVHFSGSMNMGQAARPAEFTIKSSSVYKGSDCGDVKPLPMPTSAPQPAKE